MVGQEEVQSHHQQQEKCPQERSSILTVIRRDTEPSIVQTLEHHQGPQ